MANANEIIYAPYAERLGKEYDLPSGLMTRLIRSESNFDPLARNPSGAAGIAQFIPETAKRFGIDPLDPYAALKASAQYMRELLDRNSGNAALAVAQYKGYSDRETGAQTSTVRNVAFAPSEDEKQRARDLGAEMNRTFDKVVDAPGNFLDEKATELFNWFISFLVPIAIAALGLVLLFFGAKNLVSIKY